MIEVNKEGILLSRTDLAFEIESVQNPAVIREGESVHKYYRTVRTGNHSYYLCIYESLRINR